MDMSDFRHWISYIDSYRGEIRGKNVGFVKIDVRDGRCRIKIGIKGAYGCGARGLEVAFFVRRGGRPVRIPVGHMRIVQGEGEFNESSREEDLFGTGVGLRQCGGLWLSGGEENTRYLTSWDKCGLDIQDFLQETPKDGELLRAASLASDGSSSQGTASSAGEESCRLAPAFSEVAASCPVPVFSGTDSAAVENGAAAEDGAARMDGAGQKDSAALETLPSPGLWDSLCRYYPKAAPDLARRGVEFLQIRPADIRYLPRSLWHLGSNSFLLHGYYRYKYLVLGRMQEKGGYAYILGVRGVREERERFSAELFGFHDFLETGKGGQEGYWYRPVNLDGESVCF